jgi:hypothetical protein
VRGRRPKPNAKRGGVFHGGEALIEALHRTFAAHEQIHHLRSPRERREPIDDHMDAEVEVGVVGVGDGAPWPEVDVESVHLEAAALRLQDLVAELGSGELDEEMLRVVGANHQL